MNEPGPRSGFFDWWENLAFLSAIMAEASTDVLQLLQIGLGFVWLKAICLFATFITTGLLILWRAVEWVNGRFSRTKLLSNVKA